MNIILFGPPGSGKGTQADKIVKNFNLHKVSTGDLLREEIKKKTDLGIKIKSEILGGMLIQIGDQIIDGSVKTRLESLRQELKRDALISEVS